MSQPRPTPSTALAACGVAVALIWAVRRWRDMQSKHREQKSDGADELARGDGGDGGDRVDALEKQLRETGVVVIKNVYSEEQLARIQEQNHSIVQLFQEDEAAGKVAWVANRVVHPVPPFNLCRALYHNVDMCDEWRDDNFAIRLNKGRYDLSGALFEEGVLGSMEFRYPGPVRELVRRMLKCDWRDEVGSLPSNAASDVGRWHRDMGSMFEDEAIDCMLPPVYLTMLIPLVELTPANGATEIKVGSHKLPFAEGMTQESWHAAAVPGNIVIFDARVVHRGGPNQTSAPRHVLYQTFMKKWWAEETREYPNTIERDAIARGTAGDPNADLFKQ